MMVCQMVPRLTATRSRCVTPSSTSIWASIVVVCLGSWSWGMGPAEKVELVPLMLPRTLFADSVCAVSIRLRSQEYRAGKLVWQLAGGSRTLFSGEVAATIEANSESIVPIRIPIPPVRDGVGLETRLQLQYSSATGHSQSFQQSLWILSRNPFIGKSQWLEKLNITLFDPQGRTRASFESAGIPFRQVREVAALKNVESGIVVVGEGVSLNVYASLWDALTTLAERGLQAICFAPSEGRVDLPGTRSSVGRKPSSIALRHSDVILEFDKRLDWRAWSKDARLSVGGLDIDTSRGQVVGEFVLNDSSWPWIEVRYSQESGGVISNEPKTQDTYGAAISSAGRLIVCGFGVVEFWDSNPSSRYFLTSLFEALD